jgi:hypothetical protein
MEVSNPANSRATEAPASTCCASAGGSGKRWSHRRPKTTAAHHGASRYWRNYEDILGS